MAQICKEVQERIEERRNVAHEECKNVSKSITETICRWLPWPFNKLCKAVTRIITEIVCGIVWVATTIVSWVTRIVCETIVVLDWIINNVVGIVEWVANRVFTIPEWLICIFGGKGFEKKYKICPLVIADEDGNPVVPLEVIQRQIDEAIRIYDSCNVKVVALPITVVRGRSHLMDISGCNASGFFASDRTELEHLTCCNGLAASVKCLRFPSGLIFPRSTLKAIWVRNIGEKSENKRGCYLLPSSHVLIASSGVLDTLAHEMGHASDLLHRDDEPDNLMAPGTVRTGSTLTAKQCCAIRTGRFVTIL